MSSLLDALRLVLNEADRGNGRSLHPLTTRTLESLLVDSLLLAQPHNYTAELNQPARAASPRAIREAMEQLEARPEHTWSVGELAGSVHVSARPAGRLRPLGGDVPDALSAADAAGQGARRAVDPAPGDTTVTEVAARWGFAHHGRLAAAYRAKFGEPPARTLRR